MTKRLIARMEVLLGGNVSRMSHRYGRDMETMGERSSRAMDRLNRRMGMVDDRMRGLARSGVALAAGFVGMQEIRRMMTLEEQYERLGISAGKTTEEMKEMRKSIEETAMAEDIKIDPMEIFKAVDAFTVATGRIDIAEAMKREMGLAIQATGSAGDEIGKLMASIFDKFKIETPEDMLAALDLLARQGEKGAIELTDLASLGPKVFSAYASLGKDGVQGLAEAGALMQVFKKGVGEAAEAGTVFENTMKALGSSRILSIFKTKGVEINDAAGNLKKPIELLKEVLTAAGGDDIKLSGVFDGETMRGLRQLSEMLRDTGGFDQLDMLVNVRTEADGAKIAADSARIAETTGAAATGAIEGVRSAISEAAAEAEVLERLTEVLNTVDKETVELLFKAAAGVGAIFAAFKIGGAVKDGAAILRSMRGTASFGASKGKGDGSVAPSAPSAAGAKVQFVRVTNWPPGFGHGGARKGQGNGKIGGAALAGGAATAAGAAAGVAPTVAAVASAYIGKFYWDIMKDANASDRSFSETRRERLGLPQEPDTLLGKFEAIIPDPVASIPFGRRCPVAEPCRPRTLWLPPRRCGHRKPEPQRSESFGTPDARGAGATQRA